MFIQRSYPRYKYNIKYALKVDRLYNNITDKLSRKGIFGCKRVYLRHKEIVHALNIGLITQEEYKHWKISHKVI